MPLTLFKVVSKKRAVVFSVSKEWYTLTPWMHKGKLVKYLDYYANYSDSRNVFFKYYYVGPFALITTRWVKA